MKRLTDKQRRVLDFIRFHVGQMGYPPSNEEIQHHFGFASPNAAYCHIQSLVKKGALVKRAQTARGITVINTVL